MQITDLLTEEVFSSLAVGYHRTRNLKNTNAIGESGFKAGDRAMYGKGIYLTYSFDDQQDERMKETYGPFIIRCKVNLSGFLVFDEDIANRVYGADSSMEDQLAFFGIPRKDMEQYGVLRLQSEGGYWPGSYIAHERRPLTSNQARAFAYWFFEKPRKLKRPIKGLVFTGQQDGRVIVAYEPQVVIPFAWARVIDLNKTQETVKWNRIAPVIAAPKAPMREFERAYRYFREQGFTLIQRGSVGAVLMGKRNGDFLSVTITERENSIRVQAYANRVDPLTTKVPNYSAHMGWPLYWKEEQFDKLPLQQIMNEIIATHDALPTRLQQHTKFASDYIRWLLKGSPSVNIEKLPGRDYGRDKVKLHAGSVSVELDKPYLDFATGKLWIATRPWPLELGFNNQRWGTGIEGAYQSMLNLVLFVRHPELLQWPNDLKPGVLKDIKAKLKE